MSKPAVQAPSSAPKRPRASPSPAKKVKEVKAEVKVESKAETILLVQSEGLSIAEPEVAAPIKATEETIVGVDGAVPLSTAAEGTGGSQPGTSLLPEAVPMEVDS